MADKMMWAYLLHLGGNMWADKEWYCEHTTASDTLRCDIEFWDEFVPFMADCGINTCVIDLAEGIKYESHPEIAVKGSWSVDFLKKKLDEMRKAGITPIPKLNFSACHDVWMGDYGRALSTKWYYDFCRDIINEVCDIFGKPVLFHLGMDEEDYNNQKNFDFVTIRQGDLWWHDFYFLTDLVEKNGARPWVWSDYYWHHPEVFLKKMPKSVLQSNWYYGRLSMGDLESKAVLTYDELEKHGYDQVPTGSNWSCSENMGRTVAYCKNRIDPSRLKGFMQAPWKLSLTDRKFRHFEAADMIKQAIRDNYK